MLRRTPCLAGFAAALLVAAPARADWLERAWRDDVVAETGTPAITLSAGGILLVLPEAALQEAHAAGVTTADAARLFVQRYGQHCSDILDLDRPHQHVKLRLFLLRPVALEDAPERVQGEILDTLKTAKTKPLPRVRNLYVTADDSTELFIDYVPARKASCVQPGDEVS
jgi:hypothetical protein